MKKNITLFIALLLFSNVSFAQTLYRTYYDYEKQHVQEEYYANSYGVKNGAYRKYSEYEGILIQGNYSNDKKEGRWVVRDDKGQITSNETYKDDVLNGPAIYYNDLYDPTIPSSSGSYKNGVKEGTWTFIKRIDAQDYRYPNPEIPQQAWSGCHYIKYTAKYNNDEGLKTNGQVTQTFYPSGKIYLQGTYKNDNPMEVYIYYPNGNLFGYLVNGAVLKVDSTLIFGTNWKYPGGNKDSVSMYNSNVIDYQKTNIEMAGEKFASQNNYPEAESSFLKVLVIDSTYNNACYNLACLYSLQNI